MSNEGNSGGHGHRGPVPYEPLDRPTAPRWQPKWRRRTQWWPPCPPWPTPRRPATARSAPTCPASPPTTSAPTCSWATASTPSTPKCCCAGTEPDSEVVGLSYLVRDEGEPAGFAGDTDVWHVHERLCLGEGGVLGIETATAEGCAARGGRMMDVGNIWMAHMWNVPGWEPLGPVQLEHPDLGGRMGDIDAPPDPEADDAWFDENPVDT